MRVGGQDMQSRPTFSKGSTLRPALFALLNGNLFTLFNVTI